VHKEGISVRKRTLILVAIALLCAGVFGGSATHASTASGLDKVQKFVFSSRSDITGLNPLLHTTGPDNGVQSIILEGLVERVADEKGNAVIKLTSAKSWDLSKDGTVYTFKIRDNAVWNDGVPVTANDFVYSFRMMADPSVGCTNAWLFDGVIQNFEEAHYDEGKKPQDIGVTAVDKKTVSFKLTKPCAYFPDLLAGVKPVRQDKYEQWGDSYGSSIDKVVMNGPFLIESWKPMVQMNFVKNPKHWDAANFTLQRIERKIIQDPATHVQALISGEIDIGATSDPDWQEVLKKEGARFKTLKEPDNAPEFFGFNCSNKYFKNPKIRLAFSLAHDREKYIEDLLYGRAEPLYSMMPSATMCGDKLYSERVSGKNQIVKTLMKKYPDPKALLIEGLKEEKLDPDPAKMHIKYATRGTAEFSKKSAEWLLQNWQKTLGVTITIDMIEWNIMWDKVGKGDYDICTSGWGPYYNDPNALLEIFDPISGYFHSKRSGWTGPDADKFHQLLDKASFTVDPQARAELLLQAEQLLVGTGVIAPNYCGVATYYVAKYVNGYYTNPHAGVDYTKLHTKGRPGR
jgi:ABC-type oligopeptide transport system substrate-binding subunit